MGRVALRLELSALFQRAQHAVRLRMYTVKGNGRAKRGRKLEKTSKLY